MPNEYALFAWQARILERTRAIVEMHHPPEFVVDDRWSVDLIALTRRNDGPKRAQALLLSKGIILVMEKHLSGTYLDGGAMLDRDGRPVIGLTLRFDRLDNFWFVLLHELGHVFLHLMDGLRYDVFDEEETSGDDKVEREADAFALDNLIPEATWDECLSRFALSEEAARIDAKNLGIDASIIAGRIRKELGDYTILEGVIGQGQVASQLRTMTMNLSEDIYVPALRWRQGKYQALFRLPSAVKERLMPLITIPPVEFDFELWQPKKSVHEHVHPFIARFEAKWGKRPAWIALDAKITEGRMNDSSHPLDYVLDGLRLKGAIAIPALPLDVASDTMDAAARAVAADSQGAAVLLRLEDLMSGNPRKAIVGFAGGLGINLDKLDVIVDLRARNFEPYKVFATALTVALKRLGNLFEVRNLVLLGTAIPDSLTCPPFLIQP